MYLPKVTEEFRARKLEEAKQFGWFAFILEWIKIKIFRRRKIIADSIFNEHVEKGKTPTFGDVFTEAKTRWDNADEQGKQLILEELRDTREARSRKEFKGELFEGLGTSGKEIG